MMAKPTDFDTLRTQAVTAAKKASDFQYYQDRDDRRSSEEIHVDATLKLVKPLVEHLEHRIKRLEEDAAALVTNPETLDKIKTNVMAEIIDLPQLPAETDSEAAALRNTLLELQDYMSDWPDDPFARKRGIAQGIIAKGLEAAEKTKAN